MLQKENTNLSLKLLKQFSQFAIFLFHTALFGQTVNYTPTTDIIANPERGLQKYSITANNYSTTAGANNLSVATMQNWKNSADKVTVVFRYFLLDDFVTTNINSIYLNNIQTDFDNIRAAGLKAIIRFSYSNSLPSGNPPQQPTKAQILMHISQLAPILESNKDVILSHQAGFIGTWGEWYYTNSTEFGTEGNISTAQWANRKDVLDAMLSATPATIPLQVRYAEIKKTMYGNSQLNPSTAYQNNPNARVGFYNDAFLNDWGDQGTYSISSRCQNPVGNTDYTYIANETKYLPMTGETNGLNICNSGFRTTGANAIMEMDSTNWTTINRDYYTPFWNNIISSNHYDEILRRLGYRFELQSSTVAVNSNTFDLTLNLKNIGFARVFKQRDVYLVLKNTATNSITTALLNTDIRTWENSLTINQTFNLGLSGTFNLYLWMPDSYASLQSNSDYSIRLANVGTWDASTGFNDLLQTITLGPPTTCTALVQDVKGITSAADAAWITWTSNPDANLYRFQYRVKGTSTWSSATSPGFPNNYQPISGLNPNATYEIRIRQRCSNGLFGPYSPISEFSTDDTQPCSAPDAVGYMYDRQGDPTKIRMSCAYEANAYNGFYRLRYREVGSSVWVNKLIKRPFYRATGLSPNTQYEYQWRTRCGQTAYSPITSVDVFTTLPVSPLAANTALARIAEDAQQELETESHILVFPNPVAERLRVSADKPMAKIQVFNIQGTIMQETAVQAEAIELDVQTLPSGFYGLRVIFEDETLGLERIIKQ